MLSFFLERPILAGISIVTTVLLINAVEKYDRYLGTFMGLDPFWTIIILTFMAVYGIIFAFFKVIIALIGEFLPGEPKKRKNRARAIKAQTRQK